MPKRVSRFSSSVMELSQERAVVLYMARLTSKQRAFVRKRSKHTPEDITDDELNIIPFLDIVINLIMFLLMVTASVAAFTELAVAMPTRGPRGGGEGPASLNLTLTLTSSGIWVSGSGGSLLPGCENVSRAGGSVTLPTADEDYNWQALSDCVARVRENAVTNNVEFRDAYGDGQITIGADPMVEYQHIVAAMDAVRTQDGEDLFPSVLLSAGVR